MWVQCAYGWDFHEMHARLRGPNNLFILRQIIIDPDFPCLADKIAESRPDMNIKVTALTESRKLYYTGYRWGMKLHVVH